MRMAIGSHMWRTPVQSLSPASSARQVMMKEPERHCYTNCLGCSGISPLIEMMVGSRCVKQKIGQGGSTSVHSEGGRKGGSEAVNHIRGSFNCQCPGCALFSRGERLYQHYVLSFPSVTAVEN
jgi:hypothetical protein